jgi:hypothetical protein
MEELQFQQIINAIHLVQEDLNIVKARQEHISGEVSNVKSELIILKSGVQQRDHNRFCPPLSANTNTSDGSFSSDLSSDQSTALSKQMPRNEKYTSRTPANLSGYLRDAGFEEISALRQLPNELNDYAATVKLLFSQNVNNVAHCTSALFEKYDMLKRTMEGVLSTRQKRETKGAASDNPLRKQLLRWILLLNTAVFDPQ